MLFPEGGGQNSDHGELAGRKVLQVLADVELTMMIMIMVTKDKNSDHGELAGRRGEIAPGGVGDDGEPLTGKGSEALSSDHCSGLSLGGYSHHGT